MAPLRRQEGRTLFILVALAVFLSGGYVVWKKASDSPEAAYRLGLEALSVRGYQIAAGHLQKASDRGHVAATAALAELHAQGFGVAKNNHTALELYRTAATAGHADAQLALARMIEEGRGTVPDVEEAALWYWTAAEQGQPEAQYAIARMYEDGIGVEKSVSDAAGWYLKAAKAGVAEAQLALGRFYDQGLGGLATSPDQAAIWWRSAAEADIAEAQVRLAMLFEEGRGVPRDVDQAAYWYQGAAKQFHPEGLYRLGRLHHLGKGADQSDPEAVGNWRRAAAKGHREAQYMLGLALVEGRGARRDLDKAQKWLLAAAEQGHLEAMAALRDLGQADMARQAARTARTRRKPSRSEVEAERRAADLPGVCELRGAVELRSRLDCLNRGGSWKPSQGGAGSFSQIPDDATWDRQREDLTRLRRDVDRERRRYESSGSSGRSYESQSSDWVVCYKRSGSDSRGRMRYRCSRAMRKTSETTTGYCRERGYDSRKLFKHETSARRFSNDSCW